MSNIIDFQAAKRKRWERLRLRMRRSLDAQFRLFLDHLVTRDEAGIHWRRYDLEPRGELNCTIRPRDPDGAA